MLLHVNGLPLEAQVNVGCFSIFVINAYTVYNTIILINPHNKNFEVELADVNFLYDELKTVI